jgi:hypothetical protein
MGAGVNTCLFCEVLKPRQGQRSSKKRSFSRGNPTRDDGPVGGVIPSPPSEMSATTLYSLHHTYEACLQSCMDSLRNLGVAHTYLSTTMVATKKQGILLSTKRV